MAYPNKILNLTENLTDFSFLVELHLNTVPETRNLENHARELIEADFPKDLLDAFIEAVHRWGGSFRNYYKVKENARAAHFVAALQALNTAPPLVETAISSLLDIHGLGISYASKHLRFLRPDICPILDDVVWKAFKYPWDARGYRSLQAEVMRAARVLEDNRIANPMERPAGMWYAADVDMAVFACLQRKSRKPGWI